METDRRKSDEKISEDICRAFIVYLYGEDRIFIARVKTPIEDNFTAIVGSQAMTLEASRVYEVNSKGRAVRRRLLPCVPSLEQPLLVLRVVFHQQGRFGVIRILLGPLAGQYPDAKDRALAALGQLVQFAPKRRKIEGG